MFLLTKLITLKVQDGFFEILVPCGFPNRCVSKDTLDEMEYFTAFSGDKSSFLGWHGSEEL